MRQIILSTGLLGVVILLLWFGSRWFSFVRTLHQRLIGASIFLYGIYLSTLTGSMTKFVIPGMGAIGGGAAAGASVGLLTYAAIGTVGVVTGGVGVGLGAFAMALIGGGLGLTGAAVGGFGLQTITYPLISPWFWVPLLVLGVYVFIGASKKRSIKKSEATLGRPTETTRIGDNRFN